jgi:hypothetical protein
MNTQRKTNIADLKKQAINYFKLNEDIPKKFEEALNDLFYDAPYDIYGYLVRKEAFKLFKLIFSS